MTARSTAPDAIGSEPMIWPRGSPSGTFYRVDQVGTQRWPTRVLSSAMARLFLPTIASSISVTRSATASSPTISTVTERYPAGGSSSPLQAMTECQTASQSTVLAMSGAPFMAAAKSYALMPSGKLRRSLSLPATFVTSLCFGGPELKTLYVTTGWNSTTTRSDQGKRCWRRGFHAVGRQSWPARAYHRALTPQRTGNPTYRDDKVAKSPAFQAKVKALADATRKA